MNGALLFVHGTGVRAAGYVSTLQTIERQVRRHGLSWAVHGSFWGEVEGAKLRIGGRSIPGYATSGGTQPTEADQVLALWAVLYTDPWYELRLLRHRPVGGPVGLGQQPPAAALRRAIEQYEPSPALISEFADAGLDVYLPEALAAIRAAPELRDAIQTAPADPVEHRRAIARAVVAAAVVSAQDAGQPAVDGATRDALVLRLTTELHGDGLGVSEFLLRPVKGMAARLVTRKLVGDRGSITDSASPAAGDILRFLSAGHGARAFIRRAIVDLAPSPVFLLAHSLGGIMCADLLVREHVANVAGLITIGSQSPFLYEIGAFPALAHPDPLPEHFPPWLNVYDRRDVLSYLGSGVFGGGVRDVEVDNGQPFPQSHSAYWTNPAVWAAVDGFVR